jgi:hypothetical protein
MIDVDISFFQFIFYNYTGAPGPSDASPAASRLHEHLPMFSWMILRVLTQSSRSWLNFDSGSKP